MDETENAIDQSNPEQPPIPTMDPMVPVIPLELRQKLGSEIDRKYDQWRQPRRTHELQWFITAAYDAGKHTSETLQTSNSFSTQVSNSVKHKKNIANKLWAKGRARHAKFVRTRPKPIVVPFTHERQDRLNARATERALDYFYERSDQEEKYNDALLWARHTGKSYWAFHWNPDKLVPIQQTNPLLQTKFISDAPEGDIELEVFSAFEMLVPDLRQSHLKNQPEIMRVRIQDVEDVRGRYAEAIEEIKLQMEDVNWDIKPDAHMGSPFEFERQIAHLSGNEAGSLASISMEVKGEKTGVLVKELYVKPSIKYPKGRIIVAVNKVALRIEEELPHTFYDMENPYPFSEFMDIVQIGQFYTTTFLEQLIPLQRGYNMVRDKLEQQIRMNVHPKWLVTKQAKVPKGSLTNEQGEVVEWNYIPGMPVPQMVQMASIVPDAWRFVQLVKEEFDDISQVYPSFEGKAGSAKSGFQTNLLQEASDNVHSPDARGYELTIKDASYKIRRMMRNGYDVPRMMSFAGRSSVPEVFEFSSNNIDEHALIRIQIGSGLSTFKAARIQQLVELHEKGILGDPNDPELKRRVLSLIDVGGIEEFQERAARDEDMARSENIDMLDGKEIPIPQFYEDHLVHYAAHTDELKSPANKELDIETRKNMIMHVILHMKFINPQAAATLAIEQGMEVLITRGLIPPPQPLTVSQPGQAEPQGSAPQQQQQQGSASPTN